MLALLCIATPLTPIFVLRQWHAPKHADSLQGAEEAISKTQEDLQPILDEIANSVPLKEMAEAIQYEKTRLASIIALEQAVVALQVKIEGLAAELNGFIEKRLALAAEVMNVDKQLLQKSDELKIEIRPFVKSQHVRDSCTTASSTSAVRTFERWRRSWSRKMTTSVPTRVQWRSSLQELLGNAIYLNYDLMLGSDSVSIMSSHSKRALTLRRVIIELDASEYPIILDQSEDDLDNPSIYDGLATYLNSKKSRFARSSWSRTTQTPWSAVTSST